MRALEGARVRLLPQRAEHAPAMFELLSDPRIYEHENAPPTSSAALHDRFARLETRRSPDGSQRWLNWVVQAGSSLIGYVQATVMPDGHALVAYEFGSRWWGQGLASEALEAMLRELVAQHGVTTLAAVLKRGNHRSMALLERHGFWLADAAAHASVDPDEWTMRRDAGGTLRVARESPRQAEAIALIDALDAYQKPLYPPESHHGIDIDALAAPDVVFAIARHGIQAVGCVAVRLDGPEAELKRMYIDPASRGGGIAAAMLRFIEGVAIVRGARWLRLETGIHQHAALALYARHGFQRGAPFGSYGPDPLSVFMHKPLVPPR